MNHPVMHDVGNTQQYSAAPHPPAPGHYGAVPPAPPPSAPGQPPSPARRRWVMSAVVGGTAVVALIAGVTLGAAFGGGGASDSGNSEGPGAALSDTTGVAGGGAPSPAEVHAQDVALCTSYAIINTAIPTPDTTGSDLLPAVAALQNALAENPYASPPVRAAVTDMTSVYEARIAAHGKVRARGLAEPPPYTVEAHKAASAEVWAVCGLDEE